LCSVLMVTHFVNLHIWATKELQQAKVILSQFAEFCNRFMRRLQMTITWCVVICVSVKVLQTEFLKRDAWHFHRPG
jgi:hypothetical protein